MSPAAYLRLLLYAEGPTDYRLLLPLLRRLTEQVCLDSARSVVDVEEVQGIDTRRKLDRAARIVEAARGFWGGAGVLFIHADGAGDPERTRAEQFAPGARLIEQNLRGGACVPVVPVREIEAWALVDGDALRVAFGTTLGDEVLRIAQRPRDVEEVLDPKQELRAAFTAVAGSPRRRRRVEDFYTRIGEQVDLAKLRQVPAFGDLERDLREALCKIGIFRAR
jgi:Domain of unknown function (DUF4276)